MFHKEKAQLSKLSGSVTVLKVGGASETEVGEILNGLRCYFNKADLIGFSGGKTTLSDDETME